MLKIYACIKQRLVITQQGEQWKVSEPSSPPPFLPPPLPPSTSAVTNTNTVLSILHKLFHFVIPMRQVSSPHHFIPEKTMTQRREVICPKHIASRWQEPGSTSGSLTPELTLQRPGGVDTQRKVVGKQRQPDPLDYKQVTREELNHCSQHELC